MKKSFRKSDSYSKRRRLLVGDSEEEERDSYMLRNLGNTEGLAVVEDKSENSMKETPAWGKVHKEGAKGQMNEYYYEYENENDVNKEQTNLSEFDSEGRDSASAGHTSIKRKSREYQTGRDRFKTRGDQSRSRKLRGGVNGRRSVSNQKDKRTKNVQVFESSYSDNILNENENYDDINNYNENYNDNLKENYNHNYDDNDEYYQKIRLDGNHLEREKGGRLVESKRYSDSRVVEQSEMEGESEIYDEESMNKAIAGNHLGITETLTERKLERFGKEAPLHCSNIEKGELPSNIKEIYEEQEKLRKGRKEKLDVIVGSMDFSLDQLMQNISNRFQHQERNEVEEYTGRNRDQFREEYGEEYGEDDMREDTEDYRGNEYVDEQDYRDEYRDEQEYRQRNRERHGDHYIQRSKGRQAEEQTEDYNEKYRDKHNYTDTDREREDYRERYGHGEDYRESSSIEHPESDHQPENSEQMQYERDMQSQNSRMNLIRKVSTLEKDIKILSNHPSSPMHFKRSNGNIEQSESLKRFVSMKKQNDSKDYLAPKNYLGQSSMEKNKYILESDLTNNYSDAKRMNVQKSPETFLSRENKTSFEKDNGQIYSSRGEKDHRPISRLKRHPLRNMASIDKDKPSSGYMFSRERQAERILGRDTHQDDSNIHEDLSQSLNYIGTSRSMREVSLNNPSRDQMEALLWCFQYNEKPFSPKYLQQVINDLQKRVHENTFKFKLFYKSTSLFFADLMLHLHFILNLAAGDSHSKMKRIAFSERIKDKKIQRFFYKREDKVNELLENFLYLVCQTKIIVAQQIMGNFMEVLSKVAPNLFIHYTFDRHCNQLKKLKTAKVFDLEEVDNKILSFVEYFKDRMRNLKINTQNIAMSYQRKVENYNSKITSIKSKNLGGSLKEVAVVVKKQFCKYVDRNTKFFREVVTVRGKSYFLSIVVYCLVNIYIWVFIRALDLVI